uniref:Uncharacterized protein n=1 Tax=Arundo donax TaxID=35708 RepID=A0A0A9F8F8_ARUDO
MSSTSFVCPCHRILQDGLITILTILHIRFFNDVISIICMPLPSYSAGFCYTAH